MKKIIFALTLLLFTFQAVAKPIDNIKQITLENGMEVFLLEDSTDALVHFEFITRAGFSSQSQDNAGFFKLYTKLIQAANKNLDFKLVQCTSDSSQYFIDGAAPETENILSALSDAMFSPKFSDDILDSELTKLKKQVQTAAEDMSVYINSAIDSKVFSDTPWKHDSGIYPPLFKQKSLKEARNHIKNISDNWYTPQNSAIFIWGNIKQEKIQEIVENTFGRFYSSTKTPVSKPLTPLNKQKKFVLHSPEISQDLTQVVIQYTMLNMEQGDILAAALNNNSSQFKQNLLAIKSLNIPGDEYINVSAAHQKDNSRLIFQTLLQKPSDKKIKTTSVEQSLAFYNNVLKIPETLKENEFQYAKSLLIKNMNDITATPSAVMINLSSFWAITPYYKQFEQIENFFYNPDSITANLMMNRINKIKNTNMKSSMEIFQSENPFIFIIINSKDYNSNKKLYKEAGFEEISTKEANWYVQSLYKEIKNKYNFEDINKFEVTESNYHDNQYYEKNISEIKEYKLKNKINVITKENREAENTSLLISIKGGKLNSSENNGFEEVMTNILASIIEKEIIKKQNEGLIISNASVSTEIKLSTSSILIEFLKEDTIQICDAIKNGLIYGQVPPAFADKEVGLKRYRKRLENGSAVNQMYSSLIFEIYGNGDLSKVFEARNEVLEDTDYLSILSAYPSLLDGSRYNIIVSGDFDKNILNYLDSSLSLLAINNLPINTGKDNFNFPSNKSVTVEINHTFLTDIPAEEAGPQPAELIPTTEFLDPVMFCIKAPDFGTKESVIFSAIIKYLEHELQNAVNVNNRLENCVVTSRLPERKTNFGTIIFQNVAHTKEIDSIYKTTIQNIINKLSSTSESKNEIQKIKNIWTTEKMKNTISASGTAYLIQEGFEQFPESPKPAYYLENYNTIQNGTILDFLKIMEYFPSIPDLRIYSATAIK